MASMDINHLAPELTLKLLAWLNPRDLWRLGRTCRKMRSITEDESLWKRKFMEAGLTDILHSIDKKILEESESENPFKFSHSKLIFIKQVQREIMLRTNTIQNSTELGGHDDPILYCSQLFDNKILCGSDHLVKVWCALTGEILEILAGHTGSVNTVQMNQEFITSGSGDHSLKVWSSSTGDCLRTLLGHTEAVFCSFLHGDVLVSGSFDKTVRVWNAREGTCLNTFKGHQCWVMCVAFNGSLVASGGADYLVKIWDLDANNCLLTLRGHEDEVNQIQFAGDLLVSRSGDRTIKLWDFSTGLCKHTIPISWHGPSLGENMALRDNILVTPNQDNTANIWNIGTGSCIGTLGGPHKHNRPITSLQFDNNSVVTASQDGVIKLWDVQTGQFIRNLLELEEGGVVRGIKMKDAKIVIYISKMNQSSHWIVLEPQLSSSVVTQ